MDIKASNSKRLVLVSGRAHPGLANEVAELLGTSLVPTTAYDFANGETFVRYEESVRVADIWAERLGAPLAIIHKRRDPNVPNQVSVHELVGDVRGRTCLLVDDMIDTAGTIVRRRLGQLAVPWPRLI